MKVESSILTKNDSLPSRISIPTDVKTVSFGQVFDSAASRQSAAAPTLPPLQVAPPTSSQTDLLAVTNFPQPVFSITKHAPPGVNALNGFYEALYSLTNQPGLTQEERNQIGFSALTSLARGRDRPPPDSIPDYMNGGSADVGFDPVRALLSTITMLGAKYPNIAKIGNAWAAIYDPVAAQSAGR